MRACPHPGCTGQVTETGYCDRTGLPVDGPEPAPSGPGPYVLAEAGSGTTDLPAVLVPDPDLLVDRQVAASECQLAKGDVLAEQYRVVGPIAKGGMGRVYLAKDLQLHDRPVALKGLLDPGDRAVREIARRERRQLVDLNHPDIVRVINYATHHGSGTDFIVLEFASGMTLEQIAEYIARDQAPFDGARVHEFILSYGIRILNALGYLHRNNKVYGDMKPQNVMHCGGGIKVIDLGGVREFDAVGPGTQDFTAPEVDKEGRSRPAADLYSVGKTLRALAARAPSQALRLGAESLNRVLARAIADDPRARFATAQEMSLQLHGVLRELRSLRLGEETFEPSLLFRPGADALDGGLGQAPPIAFWESGAHRAPLAAPPPDPAQTAAGLPVPEPDPQDANAAALSRISQTDKSLLQLLAGWTPSVEVHLLRCRLLIPDGIEAARRQLAAAEQLLGPMARFDWRLDWHRALVHLAAGEPAEARREFDRVYSALPGEYAPKLALGHCHEQLGAPERAGHFYEAVWLRNRSLGSAAFGLARIHLSQGRRAGAREVLDGVPKVSPHRTAARTAVLRILVAPGREATRDPASLIEAYTRLHALADEEGLTDQAARDRLETAVQEAVLEWLRGLRDSGAARRTGRAVRADPAVETAAAQLADHLAELRPGLPRTGNGWRERLAGSYRVLAGQAERRPAFEALLDLANATRPLHWTHKEHPWLKKIGRSAAAPSAWK